jgi:type II secretory pathway component PulM
MKAPRVIEGLPQRESWTRQRYTEHGRRVGKHWRSANPPREREPVPSPWLVLGAVVAVALYVVALLWIAWHLAGRT